MQRSSKPKIDIYELLENIRKRPGMYLSTPTLSSLRDFLTGLSVGQHYRLDDTKGESSFSDFSAWFDHHHRAPAAGTGGWYRAISYESPDEKQAFVRFFEYLATYRQRSPILRYHFTLLPSQRKLYAAAKRSVAPTHLRLTRYKGERCLFLHARQRGRHGWYVHTGYNSLAQSRRWLSEAFGITESQWRMARNKATSPRLSLLEKERRSRS
jgi:hypothetical protein